MAQHKAIVDKLLTGVSSAYIPEGYISEQILPQIPVTQMTGKLAKYGQAHLRIEGSIMSGRGKARRVEPIVRSQSVYSLEKHGLEAYVTPEDYANVEEPYDAEKDEVIGLTSMIWLEKEQSLAAALTSTSVITQNVTLAGAQQYSDYNNSTPLEDWKTARAAVKAGCGLPPNGVVMSWEVANVLCYHPSLLETLGFKYNRPGGLTFDELRNAMKVDKLWVGMASYNSAKEGQTDVLAPLWGKHITWGVFPASASKYQTSVGYYLIKAGEGPRKVYKYDVNNPPETTGLIVQDYYDMFISNAAAAYLIENAVA